MNQDELQERILMFNHLEQQESKPAAPYDPSKGMNESELRNFVRFLYSQVNEKNRANQEILEELKSMRQDYRDLLSKFDSLTRQLEKVHLENRDLKEQNGLLKSELYNSSKSRQGIEKNPRTKGKHDDESGVNGTPSSASTSDNNMSPVEREKNAPATVYHGPGRKGVTYNKSVEMRVGETSCRYK